MTDVYVFTEKLPNTNKTFDEYYLSPNGFLDTCVTQVSKIIYYDTNSAALFFKKYLISNWSCKKKDLWQIVNDLPMNYRYDLSILNNNNSLTHKERFDLCWSQLSNNDTFEKFKIIQSSLVSFKFFDIIDNPMLCSIVNFSPASKYFYFGNHFNQKRLNSLNSFNIFKSVSFRNQLFLTGTDPITNKIINDFIYTKPLTSNYK
jgi:hypothetical protein